MLKKKDNFFSRCTLDLDLIILLSNYTPEKIQHSIKHSVLCIIYYNIKSVLFYCYSFGVLSLTTKTLNSPIHLFCQVGHAYCVDATDCVND